MNKAFRIAFAAVCLFLVAVLIAGFIVVRNNDRMVRNLTEIRQHLHQIEATVSRLVVEDVPEEPEQTEAQEPPTY